MSSLILLDANLLIGAFDHDKNNPKHIEAKQKLTALLNDPEVKIAITPLIRYEVLRGIKHISKEKMQAALNDFQEFEITDKVGNRAADIFRFAIKNGNSMNKRNFDLFHYVVAESHQLQIESLDSDLSTIKQIVSQMAVEEQLHA